MRRKLLILLLVAGALPPAYAAAGGFGGPEKPQVKYNDADQATARAIVLRRSDLPGSGWKGGQVKPEISGGGCSTYHPKQAGLVVTGAAATEFARSGRDFNSLVQVLRTEHMVALDWKRTGIDPRIHACYRRAFVNELRSVNGKLESYGRIPFPQVAKYAREYRVVFTVRNVRWLSDALLIGRGRVELSTTVTAPFGEKATITKLEQTLARTLVARTGT